MMRCMVCGNDKFFHYSVYKVTEVVSVDKVKGKLIVVAEDIDKADPVEHINEFKCMKCGNVHAIGKDNGEEVLALLQ